MLSIALFARTQFRTDDVVGALRRNALKAFAISLDSSLKRGSLEQPPEKGVLVIPEQGVVFVGEQTTLVRNILGRGVPLILCTPQPTASDRKILLECGASEVITPRTWAPNHVAERVMAELILQGAVQPTTYGPLRGATHTIHELYEDIQKIAPLSEPILILGETGTGKELVAREIHKRSGRPDPFLPINCPELSPELLGSELFGHERGAFTGAVQARKGLLSEAGNGTVFLDEIGDLDFQAQAKLLRVLEDQKVRRVGANRWDNVNARIVLATNRNLREDCNQGKFRTDLYERIRGFTIELPPLRERRADIPLLVHHFVEEYNRDYPGHLTIQGGTLECLFRHDWPGNVRELRLVVRKAAAYADNDGNISAVLLQEAVRGRHSDQVKFSVTFDPAGDTWREFLHRAQVNYFRAVLAEAKGNKEAASKLAGLSRSQFYERLKEVENSK